MKASLDGGSFGRAIMMHNFHRNVEAPANFTDQMAITNSAPHEFDVARFVLGTDYRAISVFQPTGADASKVGVKALEKCGRVIIVGAEKPSLYNRRQE